MDDLLLSGDPGGGGGGGCLFFFFFLLSFFEPDASQSGKMAPGRIEGEAHWD